jgi:hypothetical protein
MHGDMTPERRNIFKARKSEIGNSGVSLDKMVNRPFINNDEKCVLLLQSKSVCAAQTPLKLLRWSTSRYSPGIVGDANRTKEFETHDCKTNRGFFISRANAGREERRKNNMNNKLIPTFGAETRFDVAPTPPAPFRELQNTEFDRLKTRLLSELLEQRPDPSLNTPLRQAVNEAAGVAWMTQFPLLVFPTLATELACKAARREQKQRQVRWSSPRYVEEAVA